MAIFRQSNSGPSIVKIEKETGRITRIPNSSPRGPQGIDGPQGIPGNNGIDGISPTIEIGTVTTGDAGTGALVVNSGTLEDVVLDFTIPQGDDGSDGAPGTPGSDGTDGNNGADGKEVEIQNNGTYIQWRYVGDVAWTNLVALVDLKGADGINGSDGTDGSDGSNGKTVLSGAEAPNNADGADGDFYIDTTDWNIYGPKTTGDWGSGSSLVGPAGAGTGDMLATTYDPNNKSSDAFSMGNMVETSTKKIMSDTERSKLSGIASGATANDTDANLKNRANHTGTQTADTITDGTTNKVYTATEKTKLSGIEASADVTDATNVGSAGAFMKSSDDLDDITDGTTYKKYSATEKTKLAGIESGAEVNDVASVAGKTGVVTLTKADVGLGSVDNTSDVDKPISDNTQNALDLKASKTDLLYAPNKYVEAMPLHHIGHSYTKLPFAYSRNVYNTEYGLRVKERLNFGDYYWYGRPGTFAPDMLGRLLSPVYDNGTGQWPQDTKGIVMLENYTNELGSSSSADSDFRDLWANSIRGEIAVVNSSLITPFASYSAISGTWTAYTQAHGYKGIGGDTRYATGGTGAYVEFLVPQGDEVWVGMMVSKSSYTISGANFTVSGTSVGSFNGNGVKPAYTDSVIGSDTNVTVRLVKITGLNAAAGTTGAKTLRVTVGTGANPVFVSGIIVPSTTPPQVFLAKEPPRGFPPTTTWTDNHQYFDDMIDTIAAEFSNVHVVDLNDGWDGSIMISSMDGATPPIHPNDIGQSHLADKFVEAINTEITDWDAGVVTI